jgi:hypothetical protein
VLHLLFETVKHQDLLAIRGDWIIVGLATEGKPRAPRPPRRYANFVAVDVPHDLSNGREGLPYSSTSGRRVSAVNWCWAESRGQVHRLSRHCDRASVRADRTSLDAGLFLRFRATGQVGRPSWLNRHGVARSFVAHEIDREGS